jgi:hypothetical protein
MAKRNVIRNQRRVKWELRNESNESVKRRCNERDGGHYGSLPFRQVPSRNEMRGAFETDDSGGIESSGGALSCSRLHQSHRTQAPW